jgi:hypothetical protein
MPACQVWIDISVHNITTKTTSHMNHVMSEETAVDLLLLPECLHDGWSSSMIGLARRTLGISTILLPKPVVSAHDMLCRVGLSLDRSVAVDPSERGPAPPAPPAPGASTDIRQHPFAFVLATTGLARDVGIEAFFQGISVGRVAAQSAARAAAAATAATLSSRQCEALVDGVPTAPASTTAPSTTQTLGVLEANQAANVVACSLFPMLPDNIVTLVWRLPFVALVTLPSSQLAAWRGAHVPKPPQRPVSIARALEASGFSLVHMTCDACEVVASDEGREGRVACTHERLHTFALLPYSRALQSSEEQAADACTTAEDVNAALVRSALAFCNTWPHIGRLLFGFDTCDATLADGKAAVTVAVVSSVPFATQVQMPPEKVREMLRAAGACSAVAARSTQPAMTHARCIADVLKLRRAPSTLPHTTDTTDMTQ